MVAVVGRRPTPPPFRLSSLGIRGHVAGTSHAVGPQAEALERAFEPSLGGSIARVGLPPHRLPAVEERPGLLRRPAERVEHVTVPTVHGVAEMRERQIGRITGMVQILVRPLHLFARSRFIAPLWLRCPITAPLAAGADSVARRHLLPARLGSTGLSRLAGLASNLSGSVARLGLLARLITARRLISGALLAGLAGGLPRSIAPRILCGCGIFARASGGFVRPPAASLTAGSLPGFRLLSISNGVACRSTLRGVARGLLAPGGSSGGVTLPRLVARGLTTTPLGALLTGALLTGTLRAGPLRARCTACRGTAAAGLT